MKWRRNIKLYKKKLLDLQRIVTNLETDKTNPQKFSETYKKITSLLKQTLTELVSQKDTNKKNKSNIQTNIDKIIKMMKQLDQFNIDNLKQSELSKINMKDETYDIRLLIGKDGKPRIDNITGKFGIDTDEYIRLLLQIADKLATKLSSTKLIKSMKPNKDIQKQTELEAAQKIYTAWKAKQAKQAKEKPILKPPPISKSPPPPPPPQQPTKQSKTQLPHKAQSTAITPILLQQSRSQQKKTKKEKK